MFRRMPGGKRPKVAIASTQRALRVPRKRIAELIAFIARAEAAAIAEVDLAVVTAGEMTALNRRYLRRSGCTDVLSFDLTGPGNAGLSAQIIVCGDVAVAEAARRGLRPQHELMLYVIHGLLHLLGHDDGRTPDAAHMQSRQEELLAEFLRRPRRSRRAAKPKGRA